MLGIIHMVNATIPSEELETLLKSVQRYIDTQAQVKVEIFLDQNLEELERKAMLR
jgi:ribosomal protein L16/L10AE